MRAAGFTATAGLILAGALFSGGEAAGERGAGKQTPFAPPEAPPSDIGDWLARHVPFSKDRIIAHIRSSGAVVAGAAPPLDTGDGYQYYWVRDGGITMMALADYYGANDNSSDIRDAFDAFFRWTQKTQQAAREYHPPDMWFKEEQAWTKYTLEGKPFHNWMSPQYDGPALRALAFIKYGRHAGRFSEYYDARDDRSVLKTDLDAITRAWDRADGYDPWEEIRGRHFFVSMVQYRALVDGADMIEALGDSANALRYRYAAQRIKDGILGRFWDHWRLVSTVDADRSERIDNDGANHKVQRGYFIDIATILGVIHGSHENTFSPIHPQVQATFYHLIDAFANGAYKPDVVLSDWSLNQWETTVDGRPVDPAIGRYPEDIYDGRNYKYPGARDHVSSGAGFWFVATDAMAEMLYKAVEQYDAKGFIVINAINWKFWRFVGVHGRNALWKGTPEFEYAMALLIKHGDRFLRRSRRHISDDGYMSEQFHFRTGWMQGTQDLCWSYASVVSAQVARQKAVGLYGAGPVWRRTFARASASA